MRNCILIISHKRPQCQTAKAIKAAGYNGDWFIVADDMDDTDYEGLYAGHVLRFSKQEYFDKVDTVDNFKKMNTPVYARKFCFDYAQKEGYDCFGLFDDDIKSFKYRYKSGKSLLSKKVQNLTPVFDAYCEYIVKSGFACGGFMNVARLIGGVESKFAKEFYYNPTNLYIINTHIQQRDFAGTLWEDTIYCCSNNMLGKVVTSFGPIAFISAPPARLLAVAV